MIKYENYREVDIPWIRNIPYHWEVTRLKSIINKSFSGVWGNDSKNDYNDIICIRITNFHQELVSIDNNKLLKRNYAGLNIREKLVRKGDILIEKSGGGEITPVGRVAYNNLLDNVLCTNFINVIRVNNQVSSRYISYFLHLKHVLREVKKDIKQTTGIQNLDFNEYITKKVLIPTLIEQQQIVKYLDWKIGEIDKLIEIEKQKKVELNELKLNILWNYIFNGERHSEYKKVNSDYINKIPKEWHFIKIKRLFRIKKNIAGELGYNVLSITQQGIKVKDISKNEGQMSSDYSKYQIVEIGDFAMNHMDLLTGYIDISNFDGVTSPDYRVFQKISHNVHSKYFLFMFQLFYKLKIFYKYGKGAANEGRWRLPAIEFLNFEVPLPDIDEQKDIVQIIENKQNTVRIKLEEINQKIVELTSLKQSLISEVVTGQIDVRNVKIPERK